MDAARTQFETFEAKLERMRVITRLPSLPDGIPAGLGEWACAALGEMALIRSRRAALPSGIAKPLRNFRIMAAANQVEAPSAWRASIILRSEADRLARRWPTLRQFDLGADTAFAHLHAANGWYEVPGEDTIRKLLEK